MCDDVIVINNVITDVLSFQSVFHCWLHDCNMDSEHLSLLLPPSESGEHNTIILHEIKCLTHFQTLLLFTCTNPY